MITFKASPKGWPAFSLSIMIAITSMPSFGSSVDSDFGINNITNISGNLINSAQIDLSDSEGEIYREKYTVREDINLPVVGIYDDTTNGMRSQTGTIKIRGSRGSGEGADEITVLEEIETENGKLVRVGLDLSSDDTAPSDVYITAEDLELLVNSDQNLVAAVEQEYEAGQVETEMTARRGRHFRSSKRVRSSGRRGFRRAGRRGGGRGWNGRCFAQVKTWLKDKGIVNTYMPGVSAKNAVSILPNYGFHRVQGPAQRQGQVCVYGTTGGRVSRAGRIHGHIEVWDGSRWAGSGWRSYAFASTGRKLLGCYEK